VLLFLVKELDDETKTLITALESKRYRHSHRVVVWVGWLDGNSEQANQWLNKHGIRWTQFSTVSSSDPILKSWQLQSLGSNAAILACRRQTTMAKFANVRPTDFAKLEATIEKYRHRD
jgi:hypothetical protein